MQVVIVAIEGQLWSWCLDTVHDHPCKTVLVQRRRRNVRSVLGDIVVRSHDHVDLEPLTITQLQG